MPFAWVVRGDGAVPSGVTIVAAEVDITMTEEAPQALLFAAMQVSFVNSSGVEYGGGHFGIMWNNNQYGGGGKSVNFGSYVSAAGVAAGVPYVTVGSDKLDVGVNLNPSVFGPPETGPDGNPVGDRTVAYNWKVGVPVRCRIERAYNGWVASFDDQLFRQQQWPGTVGLNSMVMWTEYGSASAPCKVRFSRIRFYDSTGNVYKVGPVTVNHGSPAYEKRVFVDQTGIIMDVGRSPAILPDGAVVDVPNGDVPNGDAVSTSKSRRASDIISRVRSRLDETTARFWSDPELLAWLNEALRDAGRYTKHIRDRKEIEVTANMSEYTVPDDVIEIEHVYFLPGDGRQVPMTGQSYDNMDQVWGSWQNLRVGEPRAFALWGTPPSLKIKVYPTPVSAGRISMLVVRMPAELTTTSGTVDFPPAWDDVLEDYIEMAALRKARDPRWQEAFQMYTQKRDMLDVNADYGNDPETFVFDGYAGILPRWLVQG